jgi:hypothetical protein
MVSSLDTPLTREAAQLLDRLRPRIQAGLSEVNRVPTSVLVWGPGIDSDSPLREVRYRLRSKLRENGHAAVYSEELVDLHSSYSIRLQQLIQAQEFDLVISIPCTPGSIGEVHDFAADRRVNAKLLVFINRQHVSGYGPQSLEAISTLLSCEIEYYPSETETTIIEERTLVEAQKIREMKYLLAGRY